MQLLRQEESECVCNYTPPRYFNISIHLVRTGTQEGHKYCVMMKKMGRGKRPSLPATAAPEQKRKQHLPLFSLCYPQSRGAADRQLRLPALTGTGAGACE